MAVTIAGDGQSFTLKASNSGGHTAGSTSLNGHKTYSYDSTAAGVVS
jgi:hypothetical protein